MLGRGAQGAGGAAAGQLWKVEPSALTLRTHLLGQRHHCRGGEKGRESEEDRETEIHRKTERQ